LPTRDIPAYPDVAATMVFGHEILVDTLSHKAPTGKGGDLWQYHSRGDRHSKVSCWGLLFDLLLSCPVLRDHAAAGRVGFGINHEIRDFEQDRKKNLDLVICTPGTIRKKSKPRAFKMLVSKYHIVLSDTATRALAGLPDIFECPVGNVLMALEAKACMTAHSKAAPRLHDELASSHQTVHGSNGHAIAAGLVVINYAESFISPKKQVECPKCGEHFTPAKTNTHKQPSHGNAIRDEVLRIPRRSKTDGDGFDALAIIAIECKNDGSPVRLVESPPAPSPADIFHYENCVNRLASQFASRFPKV
jgi:hypothetical protein